MRVNVARAGRSEYQRLSIQKRGSLVGSVRGWGEVLMEMSSCTHCFEGQRGPMRKQFIPDRKVTGKEQEKSNSL